MRILNFLKKQADKTFERQTEDKFYEQMFIYNPYWNSPTPNEEEVLRWEIIENFLALVKSKNESKDFNILDLGCGRGWLTNLLSNYGTILGIEPVQAVVNYAKKMFPSIEFKCGTTKTLLLDNDFKKYDLIVTSEVIEHILDDKKGEFIQDISLLLKEEGFLIITTPRKEVQEEWLSYMQPGQPIEDWITETELEKIVTTMNFSRLKLERFSIPPVKNVPKIEIYQLWLFQKKK